MHTRLRAAAFGLAVLMSSPPAFGQGRPITFDEVLAVARDRAQALGSAREGEARGELTGAQALLQSNPVLEGSGGARFSPSATGADFEVAVRQDFELGGRRGARVASAQAEIVRAEQTSHDFARLLLRDVAIAFFKALLAEERVRLVKAAADVAAELERSADRRFRAGDLPVLDYNTAVVSHARAGAEHRAAVADGAIEAGELRRLLGLPATEAIRAQGSLKQLPLMALSELLSKADSRADLKAVSAAIEQAEAEERLGSAEAWPELGLGAQYKREGADHVVLALVSVTLPFFQRGQGLQATARARASRLRLEQQTARAAVAIEIQSAFEAVSAQTEATQLLGAVTPKLDENEALSLRAFNAGEISLRELLLIRQQVLETRLAFLNQQFAAAAASVELLARAGVLR